MVKGRDLGVCYLRGLRFETSQVLMDDESFMIPKINQVARKLAQPEHLVTKNTPIV